MHTAALGQPGCITGPRGPAARRGADPLGQPAVQAPQRQGAVPPTRQSLELECGTCPQGLCVCRAVPGKEHS